MKATQHTPGKWQRKQYKTSVIVNSQDLVEQTIICQIYGNGDEAEANARLIAAAPCLLQMVKDLTNCIKRLTADGVTQEQRDTEAQWIGEAHELINEING